MRSSLRGSGERPRSSSPCRASSARLSARGERTRSVTPAGRAREGSARERSAPAGRAREASARERSAPAGRAREGRLGARAGGLDRRARAAGRPEPGGELGEAEPLEALGDRVELARAELDEAAALLAQLERLAEPGLARVEAADDLLDAGAGGLVGEGGGVAHDPSPYGCGRTDTVPSRSRSVSSACSRAPAAEVTGSPAGSSTSA